MLFWMFAKTDALELGMRLVHDTLVINIVSVSQTETIYTFNRFHIPYFITFKVWVLTVDNQDVKGYTRPEAIYEFTPL